MMIAASVCGVAISDGHLGQEFSRGELQITLLTSRDGLLAFEAGSESAKPTKKVS